MPEATLQAVADHGDVTGDTVTGRYEDAQAKLDRLADVGVSLDDVTDELEAQGVSKFEASWTDLVATTTQGLSGMRG